MRVLVLNGPNLNLLGQREPEVYGTATLDEILADLSQEGIRLGVELTFFQSNHEGALVDRIQQARGVFDGLLLNPGGLTHYSISLLDALLGTGIPAVEVHLTNPSRREPFRSTSVVARGVTARVEGFGAEGYRLALCGLVHLLERMGSGSGSERPASGQGN
ncbi:MAG: type II 3-dehydroquinate dehydratase [Deltaproteobacteria bacterium]|nr:type II 3-dehydroquinate dehydratase [Deltaproteobacteria bacterium]